MVREAIEKARNQFPDWPERPCLEEWKVREHPCPWFRFGHDCTRTWSELTHVADYVLMGLLYGALIAAIFALFYLLYASRKKRCELPDDFGKFTPPKKKKRSKSLIRTMSQDALLLNSDGSDRFVWSTYNDYERAIIWTICCCLAQCFAYVDPNGFYKILSLPVRMLSHGLIRVFVDFTLFQMAAGYRKALQPVGTPRDSGLLIGLFLSVSFLAIFLSLEYAQVPTAGLPGCANTLWNFFRHFSVSLVEFCVIFLTLRFALRVRTKLKRSKARGTRHGRVRLQAAVDQIITRTFLLCAITFCVLGWSAFVGARNAGSAYDCYQVSTFYLILILTTLFAAGVHFSRLLFYSILGRSLRSYYMVRCDFFWCWFTPSIFLPWFQANYFSSLLLLSTTVLASSSINAPFLYVINRFNG